MVNLNKAFDFDNGLTSAGVVLPQSIVGVIRSSKPTYSGDLISSIDYYNSLTQIDANRIARSDFTYSNDFIQTQVNRYYSTDGVTVFSTENMTYVYSGDNFLRIEVN